MKVTIYSPVDVFYYSFYIEGLYRLYGKENVSFTTNGFPAFAPRIMAARLTENGRVSKVVIDALDTSTIYDEPLKWCDVYGKVNYNTESLPIENQEKILAMGPSFGIRLWSFPRTIKFALSNYFKSKERLHNKRYFFTSYSRQFKRLPLELYEKNYLIKTNYVYFISSLWQNEMQTNRFRANFIEACRDIKNIDFEGGFAPRSDCETLGFSGLIAKRISPDRYVRKIKKSFVAFNTPAVQGCHGWKLAEYLALGKAIITTDFPNILPLPLEDRKHVHFVSSSKGEIEKALKEILENTEYRKRLERHSRQYFYHHLAPVKVIEKLLRHIQNI